MGDKKSDITKNRIIAASKQLFYKKGFQHTSVREIATECEMTQSLLYYYFESKEEVAAYIMAEFAMKVNQIMKVCIDYEQDPLLFMLSYVRMLIKEVSKNDKEMKFYCEIFYSPSSDRPFVHEIHDVVKKYKKDDNIPFEQVQIAHILSDSVWEGLIKAKVQNEIDITMKEILDLVDYERYMYLGIEKKVLQDKIKEAESIVNRMPIHNIHIIE